MVAETLTICWGRNPRAVVEHTGSRGSKIVVDMEQVLGLELMNCIAFVGWHE